MNEIERLTGQATVLLGEAVRRSFGSAGPAVPLGSVGSPAAADSLGAASDEEVCSLLAEVEAVGRLLDTLRSLVAAEVDERSRYESGSESLARRLGQVRGVHVVEQITRCSQAEATRRIRLGQAIRPTRALNGEVLPPRHPRVAEAMALGALGADAATIIVRCLDQASGRAMLDDLDGAEEALVHGSVQSSADLVAIQARVWREALDPDGTEQRDEELRHRRGFTVGREVDGMTALRGWADPVSAGLIRAMLSEGANPKAAPRFLSDEDSARGTETVVTADDRLVEKVTDPRTRGQRQFDILIGTITAGVRHAETPGGNRALSTVMAVVRLDDLRKGTGAGWIDDVDEPVSVRSIRQLACDAGYSTVLLGDHGEVLHLGTRERLFTAAQRKALAVRDGGCVWPGCTAPPGWCEAHHVTEWENGGKTDIDNGALLCAAHHHLLHGSEFTMRMFHGKPQLLAPPWLDPDRLWQPVGRTRAAMAA